ncbi:hypothetical protein J45TS6_01230 [Paenibacillus sp. J45TS6]|uniref:UPF0175 family protein n=1 Tax=Paenibacillus sp. J45TS6 TaxID=2807196 RepID=UPI001B07AB59|nr:UPF0175 family protein [Paenibacillus sp. J45TS6]GIP41664.1 hypothetical protein J45TS6_01230 [Paenibacillus sp. J45TS6]
MLWIDLEAKVIDKQVVITAYRQGMISIMQCAQILGLDPSQMRQVLGSIKPDSNLQNSNRSRQTSLMGSK